MLRLFEMFAGYGGASFALKKSGIPFECVGFSEIDKYAVQCYQQNHLQKELPKDTGIISHNYGDCTKIDTSELPDFDLLTGGFPCQSFSIAGKGKGELDTRGTLFNEIIRIAEVKKPKYMLLENVKGLTFKKHKETFEKILSELDRIGYNVFWKVLNSKEHGIPQNRERVFFYCYRNDVVGGSVFEFPDKKELKILVKDILEDEVDEKYYLSEERVKGLLQDVPHGTILDFCQAKREGKPRIYENIAPTLSARDYKEPRCVQINNPKHSQQRVYSPEGVSPTISAGNLGGGKEPCKIIQIGMINQTCKKRIHDTPKEINEFLRFNKGLWTLIQIAAKLELPKTQVEHYFRTDKSRAIPSPKVWKELKELLCFRDDYDSQVIEIYEKEIEFESTRRVYSSEGISPTISCVNADKLILHNLTIRKLTPRECFRLMGFLDDEINLDGLSDTQRYKLAGNGWDINLVSSIFKNMFTTLSEEEAKR